MQGWAQSEKASLVLQGTQREPSVFTICGCSHSHITC